MVAEPFQEVVYSATRFGLSYLAQGLFAKAMCIVSSNLTALVQLMGSYNL